MRVRILFLLNVLSSLGYVLFAKITIIISFSGSAQAKVPSIFILEGKENLYEELLNQNIQCVKRGKGVRVSFHYYNTEEDLDKLISALKITTT